MCGCGGKGLGACDRSVAAQDILALIKYADAQRARANMTLRLLAEDSGVLVIYHEDEGRIILLVNLNDVEAPASADAEEILPSEIEAVYEAWKQGGQDAVIQWALDKRHNLKERP